jgi:MFS family permease
MAFFGQWSGNGPVSYYYPQMLQGAGITDNHTRLLYNGCQNVVSFGGAVIGAIFTDKWGRRPQLLVSTGIIVGIFCIITAINATNVYTDPITNEMLARSSSASKAEIAFIFIFGFVISAGYTPLQALYPVEVLRYESRAKGMGFYNFWVNIASFYNTFVTGIAFTGAGWKYYFLFIFWDLFEFVFIYFLFVETKNRTLEELTEIFKAKNPVKFSLKKKAVKVDQQGRILEEVTEQSGDVVV